MNTQKILHTPGPWKAIMRKDAPSGLLGDNGVVRWAIGSKSIAPLAVVRLSMENEQGEANAHIIAAAPELLEILRDCESELEYIRCYSKDSRGGNVIALLDKIRTVIAKADGSTGQKTMELTSGMKKLKK